jgi:hypothetical protein
MLDKIPAETRHIVIMLLAAVLGWASDNVLNLGLNPLVASLAGVVVGTLILWVTPMTRQYGIGKDTNDDLS